MRLHADARTLAAATILSSVRRCRSKREATVRAWDVDRYEQLQDHAWELDAWANEQDRNAKRHGRASEGPANRARAVAHRNEAARLLTDYWALPTTAAPLHPTSTPGPRSRTVADALPAVPSARTNEEAAWGQTAEARADDDGWPIRADTLA
jgi:hypothetical protein